MTRYKYLESVILYFITIFLYFIFIFGRSFTGLYIFGFRVGELIIGLLLFFSIWIFAAKKDIFLEYSQLLKVKNLFNVLLLAFLLTSLLTDTNIFDPYAFKVSSYIWVFPTVFIGFYFGNHFLNNKKIAYFIATSLPVVYVLSTVKFPQKIISFFINYSDKFDFVKASDLLLVYVFVNILNRINFGKTTISYSYFLFSSAIMLPMFLFKSKGAFVACIIFVALEVIHYRTYIKKNLLKALLTLVLTPALFVVSSFEISGDSLLNGIFIIENQQNIFENEENFDTTTEVDGSQDDLIGDNDKNTNVISETLLDNLDNKIAGNGTSKDSKIFEIDNGRIYSSDNTLNWRFQIWQDVIYDLMDKGQLLTGYGYREIIPAMNTILRSGVDNGNENVHNFFVNIIARGGILQFIIFISIFYKLINSDKSKNTLFFLIPLIIVSMFDSAMESVRFPIVVYFIIGSLISFNNEKKSDIIK